MCCKEFYSVTERLNVNIDMFWGGLFGVIWGFLVRVAILLDSSADCSIYVLVGARRMTYMQI